MFWYDLKLLQIFQSQTQNLAKFVHFQKFVFIQI
jgi:hypothetical protein